MHDRHNLCVLMHCDCLSAWLMSTPGGWEDEHAFTVRRPLDSSSASSGLTGSPLAACYLVLSCAQGVQVQADPSSAHSTASAPMVVTVRARSKQGAAVAEHQFWSALHALRALAQDNRVIPAWGTAKLRCRNELERRITAIRTGSHDNVLSHVSR